jgi:hypothetical protein
VAASVLSLRTKKSKRSSAPARASEAYVARKPAKARPTCSLQMGMTTAVRASRGISPTRASDRVMA